jgi:mannose-6-phosphate isomerase-like protein (cupin superfamily)
MHRIVLVVAALLFVETATVAQTPVAPALFVPATDIASALQRALAERPGMGVSTITTTDQYRINLITRTEPAGAIVHVPGTELHFITEGAATLVTGGIVVRPAEGAPGTIEGGVAQRVTKGDAVLIPEGTPHQYTAVEGAVTYLEVRFNVPVSSQP